MATQTAKVGERNREVRHFIENELDEEGRKRSVVVLATSDRPAPLPVRACFVAIAIVEQWRIHHAIMRISTYGVEVEAPGFNNFVALLPNLGSGSTAFVDDVMNPVLGIRVCGSGRSILSAFRDKESPQSLFRRRSAAVLLPHASLREFAPNYSARTLVSSAHATRAVAGTGLLSKITAVKTYCGKAAIPNIRICAAQANGSEVIR